MIFTVFGSFLPIYHRLLTLEFNAANTLLISGENQEKHLYDSQTIIITHQQTSRQYSNRDKCKQSKWYYPLLHSRIVFKMQQ